METVPGLDIVDPQFYEALVAIEVSRRAPTELFVRSIRYENPFGEELGAIGTGAEALSTTAGAIEALATLPDRRAVSRLNRRVAEATEYDQIRQARQTTDRGDLENEILEQELLARKIQNLMLLGLSTEEQRRVIIRLFTAGGHHDLAEAAGALDELEVSALLTLAALEPSVQRSTEPDPS
ncbi:MAG: hypothetical protein ACOYL9_15500 [Ilumatobacteraceae bacterium]